MFDRKLEKLMTEFLVSVTELNFRGRFHLLLLPWRREESLS